MLLVRLLGGILAGASLGVPVTLLLLLLGGSGHWGAVSAILLGGGWSLVSLASLVFISTPLLFFARLVKSNNTVTGRLMIIGGALGAAFIAAYCTHWISNTAVAWCFEVGGCAVLAALESTVLWLVAARGRSAV